MRDLKKINTILLSLIFLCLVFFSYLFSGFQAPQVNFIYALDSFFLLAAVCGSFLLYTDFVLKKQGKNKYLFLFYALLAALLIWRVFLYNAPVFYGLIIIFWTMGLIHLFILGLMLPSKNHESNQAANDAAATYHFYFYLYLLTPLCIIMSNYFLLLSGQNHPLVKDEFLLAMDGTLGIYPSLIIGHFISLLPDVIRDALTIIYLTLPLAFIVICKKRYAIEQKLPFDLFFECLLIGVLGYALYNIIPGCGTRYAFASAWPNALPTGFLQEAPQLIFCPQNYPRNCLPSLHMAWIICLLRSSRLCDPSTKTFFVIIAICTIIAMFGQGAHYFIDLIVGFSFANVIGGLSALKLSWKNPARLQAVVIGFSLCLGWYLLILYGLTVLQLSKVLAWFLFLSSILLGIRIELKLIQQMNSTKAINLEKTEIEPNFSQENYFVK